MSLANLLDKRVTIQAKSEGQGNPGQPLDVWVDVVTERDGKVWAWINDISGREFVAADGEQAQTLTTILIRFRPGITAAMRVLHGADVYNIEAVLAQGRRTMRLMCSKGVAL